MCSPGILHFALQTLPFSFNSKTEFRVVCAGPQLPFNTMQENNTFTQKSCKSYRDANSKSPFLFAQLKIHAQLLWSHDHCTKPELGFLSNKKVDYHVDIFWCQILRPSRGTLGNR